MVSFMTKSWLDKIPNLDKNRLKQFSIEKRMQTLRHRTRKMNQEQLSYIFETFDKEMNQHYEFSIADICNIIDLKLQIIASNEMKIFDIEKLYYIIKSPEWCQELVDKYMDSHNNSSFVEEDSVLSFIHTILGNSHSIATFFEALLDCNDLKIISHQNIMSSIIDLGADKFLQLVQSNHRSDEKMELLTCLTNDFRYDYVKKISCSDFSSVMDCALGNKRYLHERLLLLKYSVVEDEENTYINQDIVKNISELPDFLLDEIKSGERIEEYGDFIKSISKKQDYFVINEVRETPLLHQSCIRDIFFSKNFYQLEYMMRLMIIRDLCSKKRQTMDEDETEIFDKKLNFLLFDEFDGQEGFVSFLDNYFILDKILLFIRDASSSKELDKKIYWLIERRKEIKEGTLYTNILNQQYEEAKDGKAYQKKR